MYDIDSTKLRKFRQFLDAHSFNADSFQQKLGSTQPPTPDNQQAMLDGCREINVDNVLIRLFLLGLSVDESVAREFLPESILSICQSHDFVERVDGKIAPRVVIIPVVDLLFVSDAYRMLGTDRAAEFVLPAGTHSADFLRKLTLRQPVETAMDLGCGCGVHALFLAQHSKHVVATDVSQSALRYTAINAAFNDIDNIEILEGSLFEPVSGRRFDLITSNPPFVISPSDKFVYRDNALELDNFCELLTKAAPQYLNDQGRLQMLAEWVELTNVPWLSRLQEWIRGCNVYVLQAPPVSPQDYVAQRSSDISGDAVDAGSVDVWLRYLEDRNVQSIHPGMLVLIKSDGANWLHAQDIHGDIGSDAGAAVFDTIAAVEFLEDCDDESLRAAVFDIAESLTLDTAAARDGEVRLRLANGLTTELTVDHAVATLLKLFENGTTVGEILEKFESIASSDATGDSASDEVLNIVRVFVSRLILVPAALA